MQYTTFGKSGVRVSRLGFGCMRLPSDMVDGKQVFNVEESVRMMHRAIELGVNYFDTAPYYCEKQSEIIVGKALAGGLRDKVLLSTKYPTEKASADDLQMNLEKSLTNLQTDHIDFYHMWGINLDVFEKKLDVPGGPLERARKLMEQGMIRHISFSFHDKPENMIEIIRRGGGLFSSVLCQYNVLDQSNQDSIAYAHEQGMGVTIMGPVGGGRLGAPSSVIQSMLPGKVQSSAEVALRFVLGNPNVSIALSGMSTMQQVEENCAIASNENPLTEEEKQHIVGMIEENRKLADLYCTGCNYCMPCPKGLNIPEIFKLMNLHRVYKLTDYARGEYGQIGKVNWRKYENAAACVQCGLCEQKCPQKLPIREQLKATHDALGQSK